MLTELRSSARKLATVFRQGREAWKTRAQEQQQRAKKLDGQVRDLTRSRDRWKTEAKKLKQQLRELELAGRPGAGAAGTLVLRGGSAAPLFYTSPSGRASRSS